MADPAVDLAGRLRGRLRGTVALAAPLAPFTTYRLGGPAAVLVEAEAPDDLDAVAAEWDPASLPLLVVGRGSNTLIADSGWPGLAVHLGAGFTWMRGIGGATVASGGSTPM